MHEKRHSRTARSGVALAASLALFGAGCVNVPVVSDPCHRGGLFIGDTMTASEGYAMAMIDVFGIAAEEEMQMPFSPAQTLVLHRIDYLEERCWEQRRP